MYRIDVFAMKKLLLLSAVSVITFFNAAAQEYPIEWERYTSREYIYDIKTGSNTAGMSETDFTEYLLNSARTGLALQIQVHVKDVSELAKEQADGRISIEYSSRTNVSTDLDLKLVRTKTAYDAVSGQGYAIAYVNRDEARSYYVNELTLTCNSIDNSIILAGSLESAGFKSRARTELESSKEYFASAETSLFWMNIFGMSQPELSEWQERLNAAGRKIEGMLSELEHATAVCLSCNADIFGVGDAALQNELKGILSEKGCSFVEDPSQADWSVSIEVTSREYNKMDMGSGTYYFSYADADISIDRILTSQRIYGNRVSAKGGHTKGYAEAARAAFKDLAEELGTIIIQNIQL